MKNTFKYLISLAILSFSTSATYAKVPESISTIYGIHEPIDTSIGGVEWIFTLALFVFVTGLVLMVNGKIIISQLKK